MNPITNSARALSSKGTGSLAVSRDEKVISFRRLSIVLKI